MNGLLPETLDEFDAGDLQYETKDYSEIGGGNRLPDPIPVRRLRLKSFD